MSYFTASPKVARRMQHQVLSAYARENGMKYLDVDDTVSSVRSTLAHLVRQSHYHSHLGAAIADLRDAHNRLLSHDDIDSLFSPEKQAELQRLLQDVLDATNKWLIDAHTEADFALFCDIVVLMRTAYHSEQYDPDDFIPENMFVLSKMIRDNFAAYDKTLHAPVV